MNNELFSKTLNEKEAAQYVGMSVSFLQKDRMNGILPGRTHGPRYRKARSEKETRHSSKSSDL